MTEPMKTAEQILFEIIGPLPVPGQRKWAAGLSKQYLIIKAMEAYAAQQVAAERERIKDTLNKVQGSWSYQQVIELIDSM